MTNEEAVVKIGEHQRAIVESAQKTLFADFDSDLTEALGLAIGALKERKTGKWIETGYIGNGNYNFECSECHHSDQHTKAVVVPYCWHCGAKMEVGE